MSRANWYNGDTIGKHSPFGRLTTPRLMVRISETQLELLKMGASAEVLMPDGAYIVIEVASKASFETPGGSK